MPGAAAATRLRRVVVSAGLPPDGVADVPRTEPSISFPVVTGTTRNVNSSATWDSAIAAAVDGDEIVLTGSFTLSATKTLPNRGTSGKVLIRSDHASFQSTDTNRIAQGNANVRTITSASGAGALAFANGASGWYFCGVKIVASAASFVGTLVSVGAGVTSDANRVHDIVFERCILKGDTTLGARRGLFLDSHTSIVKGCQIYDFKENGNDTQAILSLIGYNLLIVNNLLEASGENLMTGGGDPGITNAVPEDITIRGNHFYKPTSWNTFPAAQTYTVKNLLEIKNGRRILIDKNYFQNQWEAAQNMAVNFKSTNQNDGGGAPWCLCQHITMRNNKFANIENWVKVPPIDNPANAVADYTSYIQIRNNLVIITRPNGGSGRFIECVGRSHDIRFQHNTGVCSASGGEIAYMSDEAGAAAGAFQVYDNIFYGKSVGLDGPVVAEGSATMTAYTSSGASGEHHNAMVYRSGTYGTGTIKPADEAAALFTNAGAGDYTLQGGSPCKSAASDGTDMGADVATIETYATAAINGTAT